MPILIYFGKSKRKDKKKVMIFRNPSMNIHFGSNISKTYVEGASKKTRDNYLKRHRPRENWDKINAGSASAIILWGKSQNINTNLKNYIKKFNIKDNRKRYPKKYVPNVLSEKVKKEVMSWIPMQRFGEPEEIAPIAAFLSREEARYITGEIIRVDGGMAI